MELKKKREVVRWTNEGDAARVMDVSADVVRNEGVYDRVESGNVTKDGVLMANFNTARGMEEATAVTYYNDAASDVELQCAVNRLVVEFINSVK